MRLAILTQYYPPEIGAPQARLSELASIFVRRGHQVSVVTALPNYPTGRLYPGYRGVVRREVLDGVRIIRAPIYPTQAADTVRRLTSYFSFVFSSALVGGAWLERPDYLLVESPPLFLGLSGLWLSRLKRTRLIFNVSDLWPASAVHLGVVRPSSVGYWASARLESLCYRRAWLVTGQSREIVDDIAGRFPECPTYHLSNGVDIKLFRPDRTTDAARALLRPSEGCVALYAGLHGLAQGLDQLLEAARNVGPGLGVVLAGDGPEKRKLMDWARADALQNVRFLNPLPRAELPALIAAADIVVVPLRTRIPGAVPSKLYEAMASGRAVVLVAEGESARIVRDSKAGLVVRPGDTAGLAAALRALDADPRLRATLGENGRRAVEREYDRTEIGTQFAQYLEERQ